MAKNVYHIINLRTTKFFGIYGFLWLVFITHNLVVWFKAIMLYDTNLKNIGVSDLVKKVGNVRGFVKKTIDGIEVQIPPITKLARLITEALCTQRYVQLSFEILRI